jgi:hypothetical protein
MSIDDGAKCDSAAIHDSSMRRRSALQTRAVQKFLVADLVANTGTSGITGDIYFFMHQQLADPQSHFPEFESLSLRQIS